MIQKVTKVLCTGCLNAGGVYQEGLEKHPKFHASL